MSKRSGTRSNKRKLGQTRPSTPPPGSSKDSTKAAVGECSGDAFDGYLARLGLVKKIMPNDNGSSLYRAICESLSMTQTEHTSLKEFIEGQLSFQYMMEENKYGVVCVNKTEDSLKMLANLLSIDLHVYRRIDEGPDIYRASSEGESAEKVMLCETSEGHFNLVITKEDHDNLAMAQSLVYDALYSGVLGFSRDAINGSINKLRKTIDAVGIGGIGGKTLTPDNTQERNEENPVNDEDSEASELECGSPIPLSSVKALDPTIYRNLAYELFEQNQYQDGGSGDFQPGSPCIVKEGGAFQQACVLSAPDKDTRVILVNGIEKKMDVLMLLPSPPHVALDQNHPGCSKSVDTENKH